MKSEVFPMKKAISLFLLLLLLTSLFAFPVHAEADIKVFLNNNELSFDQPPIIENDRTLVPMRAVFEAFGADVNWVEFDDIQMILAVKNDIKIFMAIDETTFYKYIGNDFEVFEKQMYNMDEIDLDVAPMLVNGRTLIPLRAVSEALDIAVEWAEESNSVFLTCTDEFLSNKNTDKEFAVKTIDFFEKMANGEDREPSAPTPSPTPYDPNKLTVLVPIYDKNTSENKSFQELETLTGIRINYIDAKAASISERLAIMLASGDLTDILIVPDYINDLTPHLNESTIVLDDYLKYAPNFKKIIENPEIRKDVISTDGKIYKIPQIYKNPLPNLQGMLIRKDWLDELNLPVPKTMADCYTTLKAFKEKKNAEAPFTIKSTYTLLSSLDPIIGAYGISSNMYDDNGVVKYGPITQQYKQFLIEMNRWYSEGLLDNDFATNSDKTVNDNLLSGKSGAAISSFSNTKTLNQTVPFAAVQYPDAVNAGIPRLSPRKTYVGAFSAYISKSCKKPETAVKWLDYFYSEEGSLLMNYGLEGVSYHMVDGKPQFTDLILKNPDGLSPEKAISAYTATYFPFLYDFDRNDPLLPAINKNSIDIWSNIQSSTVQNLPQFQLTGGDYLEYIPIVYKTKAFVEEMTIRFIIGKTPISEFDNYVEEVKAMGIDQAIKIQQNQLDSYYANIAKAGGK